MIPIRKALSLGAAFLAGAAATTMLGASVLSQPADPGDAGMPPEMDPAGMQRWMEFMTPGEQHAKLQEDVGAWNIESKFWMDPAGEPEVAHMTSVVTSELGGRFCVERMTGEVMGMPFEGMGIVGYDNHKEKWVSIWMDNMSTSIYYTEGEEAPNGTVVLSGEFYDPMTDTVSDQRIILDKSKAGEPKMRMQNKVDGKWQTTMVMTYSRAHDGDAGHGDHDHHDEHDAHHE
ncbi:MAG: DUF1579 family protein [Phycisphaerales bacterium JB050]